MKKKNISPKLPIAVRPSNVDDQPEPKRTYRKTYEQQPHSVEQRRLSFKRNRDAYMRNLMKGAK